MKKILTNGLKAKTLMYIYGLNKSTAYRAVARGYFCLEYHKKAMHPLKKMCFFNTEEAYKIAKAVFFRHFYYLVFRDPMEDCVQEAVLRMIELSGKSQDGNFFYKVALNAMRDYLAKWGFMGARAKYTSLQELDPEKQEGKEIVNEYYLPPGKNKEFWASIRSDMNLNEWKKMWEWANDERQKISPTILGKAKRAVLGS